MKTLLVLPCSLVIIDSFLMLNNIMMIAIVWVRILDLQNVTESQSIPSSSHDFWQKTYFLTVVSYIYLNLTFLWWETTEIDNCKVVTWNNVVCVPRMLLTANMQAEYRGCSYLCVFIPKMLARTEPFNMPNP